MTFPDYDFGKVFSFYRRVVKFVRNLNILLIKLYHQTPIQSTQSLKYRQLLISSTATLLAITIILGSGYVANNLNASNVTIWKQFIQTCLYPDCTFPQRNAWLPGLFSIFQEHVLFKCTKILQNYISLIFPYTVIFLVVFSCQAHSFFSSNIFYL